MGRHSAPDEDGDLLVAPPVVEERPRPRPRHAAADEPVAEPGGELLATEVIEPELVERAPSSPRDVVDADIVEDEPPPPQPIAALEAAPAPPKKERPSRVDLRLLRQSSSLRARCLAALLLPFILYTIVLVVISRVDSYLIWIWLPAILAGVLFGAQLDGAAKRAAEK